MLDNGKTKWVIRSIDSKKLNKLLLDFPNDLHQFFIFPEVSEVDMTNSDKVLDEKTLVSLTQMLPKLASIKRKGFGLRTSFRINELSSIELILKRCPLFEKITYPDYVDTVRNESRKLVRNLKLSSLVNDIEIKIILNRFNNLDNLDLSETQIISLTYDFGIRLFNVVVPPTLTSLEISCSSTEDNVWGCLKQLLPKGNLIQKIVISEDFAEFLNPLIKDGRLAHVEFLAVSSLKNISVFSMHQELHRLPHLKKLKFNIPWEERYGAIDVKNLDQMCQNIRNPVLRHYHKLKLILKIS